MANENVEKAAGEMEKYILIARLGELKSLVETRLGQLRVTGAPAGRHEKEAEELEGFVSVAGTVLRNINNIAKETIANLIKKAEGFGLKQEI